MSYVSPEGIVIPAGGDAWNLTTDLRTQAASTRSVVSVADRTAAEAVATAMASDGRTVSGTNPLVVFNRGKRALEVKDNTGWVDGGYKAVEYGNSGFAVSGGLVSWDVGPLTVNGSINYANTFANVSGALSGAVNITENGFYAVTFFTKPNATPGNSGMVIRDGAGLTFASGFTNGTIWEICATFVGYLAGGTYLRGTLIQQNATTNSTRVSIVRLQSL